MLWGPAAPHIVFFKFNKLIKAYLDGAASHLIKNIKRDAAQSAKDSLS